MSWFKSNKYVVMTEGNMVIGELDNRTAKSVIMSSEGVFDYLQHKDGRKIKTYRITKGFTYGSTTVRIVIAPGSTITEWDDNKGDFA